jgi:energy-coupling factor transport system substrate-specific component
MGIRSGAAVEQGQASEKKSRGLIAAGVFAALYFLVFVVVGSICMPIPVLYLLMPVLVAFLASPVFAMLTAKAPIHGPYLIAALLPGLFLLAMGNIWTILLTCLVAGILCELVLALSRFKRFLLNILAYVLFVQNLLGGFLPIWIMRDYYFTDTLARGMSADFCATVEALTPPWALVAMIVATALAAILGAVFSRRLFKKHFVKAGII